MSNKARDFSSTTRHSNRNATVDRRLKKAASTAAQSIVERELSVRGTGPDIKKHWTIHDMKQIQPKTIKQSDMARSFCSGKNVVAVGSAGTGKTVIALVLALGELLNPDSDVERITLIRSAVATRDIGHLPGTVEEKQAVYEQPYRDLLAWLFGRVRTYDDMKAAGLIDFQLTSFVRGNTWDDTIVIVDEIQNMRFSEIDSVVTRLGNGSRVILCGDVTHQCDLDTKREASGASQLVSVASHMEEFEIISFASSDIVRSSFVKNWIIARDGAVS